MWFSYCSHLVFKGQTSASSSNLCDAQSFRQLRTNNSFKSIFNNHFAPVTYSMVKKKRNIIKWLLEKKYFLF